MLFALEEKCFVSSKDIGAGSLWLPELLDELKRSDYGIICVTRESIERSWMVFEAGALAMRVEGEISRVCPLLLDISDAEFKGPLTAFQARKLDLDSEGKSKEDIFSIVKVLNSLQEEGPLRLKDGQLAKQFDLCWPGLWESYLNLRSTSGSTQDARVITRDEIVGEVRGALRQIADTLLELRKGMTVARRPEIEEPLQRFDVLCPHCNSPAAGLLPNRAGQTKPIICEKCGGRFNVHTTGAGSVFVRAISVEPTIGGSGPMFVAEASCPKCSEKLSVEMRDRLGETRFVVCPNCGVRVAIHRSFDGVFARAQGEEPLGQGPAAWVAWLKRTNMYVPPDVLQKLIPKAVDALASIALDRQLTATELCREIRGMVKGEAGNTMGGQGAAVDFVKAVLMGGGFTFGERLGVGVWSKPITNAPTIEAILLAYARGDLRRLRAKFNLSEEQKYIRQQFEENRKIARTNIEKIQYHIHYGQTKLEELEKNKKHHRGFKVLTFG